MNKVLKRKEVDLNTTWDLTVMFENDEKWLEEFNQLSKDIKAISKYENIMCENVENFKETIILNENLSQRLAKLYIYAHLKSDEDTTNSKYQEYNAKILSLNSELVARSTYIEIKILQLDEKVLEKYLEDNEISHYKFYISQLISKKENILTQKEEEVLATLQEVMQSSAKTFSMINNADITFDDILDSDGNKYPMSHSRYSQYLESHDRNLRKNAYNSMYNSFGKLKNTLASTLEGNVKKHTLEAKLRKYTSARNAALSSNYIPENVYNALLNAVNDRMDLLHKYVELRKEKLKLDSMYMYDMYVPLLSDLNIKFTYDEAKKIIIEALSVLGEEYVNILNKAFDERWIDYCENEGKRSGAYSSGTYGTRPYILISYRDTFDNLFTLAHELGHSIHSYYTRNNQKYIYGNYTIFLAEVASITNEMLLSNYLLEKYKDNKEMKIYLLNHSLERVKSTLFRQTQFAEFEFEIHKALENGQPLTSKFLSNLYFNINKKYYGESIIYDDNISYEWSRIPHFYYNFYVYQYATGISAASSFAKQILTNGEESVKKYIEFLKSGSSNYSIEILKKAGVDMSTSKPIHDCLDNFEQNLKLIRELM